MSNPSMLGSRSVLCNSKGKECLSIDAQVEAGDNQGQHPVSVHKENIIVYIKLK